ncbi:hypothetical protein BOX15_Mlig006531g3 [Macrostomum lignano]|uniref:Uncharacterized protein n=2 Tax=Macrostomum lignano TaxID=282301 RepID=A0A267F496_9PLAT|nr:hypothetical protein BOX15_Mlig006531g1 [Macrostomum lignano]PAA81296.1 hypothetical protein BOX15_Mlig006531g3 [Macrostomum lignano]
MGKVCFQCLKVFIIISNTICLLAGLAIMALSLYLYFDASMVLLRENSGNKLTVEIALFVVMAIGGVTALVSAFGCCGAIHESPCLLGSFFICLLIICGVEIGGGLYLYVRQMDTEVKNFIINEFRNNIKNWNLTSIPDTAKWAQKSLRCCGANGTADYIDQQVPAQFCKADDGTLFTQGCIGKILAQSLWVLITVLSIAAVELFSLIVAMYLCCAAKRDEEGYVGVSTD